MTCVLRFDDVRFSYTGPDGPVPVLHDVSLEVERGECVAIVGPSGSGKSTALHLAGGLAVPTSGRITVAGLDVATLDARSAARLRAERIGMVFQAFHLLGHLTALENVMLSAWIAGRPRSAASASASQALDAVDLASRARHRPSMLSGGEQQRVAVARAIVNAPDVVLADEPTGNLDAAASSRVAALLARLVSEGTTLMLATHDPGLAAVAHRVIELPHVDSSRTGDRRL